MEPKKDTETEIEAEEEERNKERYRDQMISELRIRMCHSEKLLIFRGNQRMREREIEIDG